MRVHLPAWKRPAPTSADRNLRFFYAFSALSHFSPWSAIWIVYLTGYRDLTLAQVGLMELVFWSVALLLEVPSGAFSDRFGRRLSFKIGLVLEGFGILFFGLADSFAILIVSYVIWSVALSLRSGNDAAYLYDLLASAGRKHDFPRHMGRISAIYVASALLAALLGGVVAAATSLQVPVLLGAVVVFGAFPLVALMEDPPTQEAASRRSYRATVTDGVRLLVRDRALGLMALLGISFFIVTEGNMLLMQPSLERFSVPLALFAVVLAPIRLLGVAGALMAHRLPRLLGVHASHGVLLVAASGAFLFMAAVDHVVGMVGFAVAMFAMHAQQLLMTSYLNERTPSDLRATVLSVPPFGRSVVLGIGGPVIGAVATTSLPAALAALGVAMLIGGGAIYLCWLLVERAAATPAAVVTTALPVEGAVGPSPEPASADV